MYRGTKKPAVYVTQKLQEPVMEILKKTGFFINYNNEKPRPYQLIQDVKHVDGLVCLITDKITKEVISQNPKLKIISTVSVGYDHIAIDYATSLGIPVTNTPGVLTHATADHAFLLMMSAARNLVRAEKDLREGKFTGFKLEDDYLGLDLYGKTLGIVGFGQIGRAFGKRAYGFDMDVLYHNRKPLSTPDYEKLGYMAKYVSLDELLRKSDVISLHVPSTQETNDLFGEREFSLMKPTALFVNTSRGSVVDEEALNYALKNGIIAGAGIDVFKNEPTINPVLLQAPNLTITPHIGSSTTNTRMKMAELAVKNLIAVLEGRNVSNVVNPDYIHHARYKQV